MDKEIENMTKEEQLALLREINPKTHRVFSALLKSTGDDGLPDSFSYVRALQEYDKENGIKPIDGLYTHLIKEVDKLFETNRSTPS